MKRKTVSQLILTLILLVVGFIFLLPVFYLLLNSFKPKSEIMLSFVAWPKDFSFMNYINGWKRINYPAICANTLFLSVGSVIITLLFSSLCGYKLQRTASRISKILYYYFLFGLIIPFTVIMVPISMLMLSRLKLGNNLVVLPFLYAALYMPLTVFIYYGYCKSVPRELDEVAMIDGCNPLRTFFQVILPLTGPILVSIAVLSFLWTWNDFMIALITLDDPALVTITRRINNFVGYFSGVEWDYFTAIISLAMLPILILYAALQKYVMRGMISGALKG
jgi:raffinose/stachyose/melibiose transport system permease protein